MKAQILAFVLMCSVSALAAQEVSVEKGKDTIKVDNPYLNKWYFKPTLGYFQSFNLVSPHDVNNLFLSYPKQAFSSSILSFNFFPKILDRRLGLEINTYSIMGSATQYGIGVESDYIYSFGRKLENLSGNTADSLRRSQSKNSFRSYNIGVSYRISKGKWLLMPRVTFGSMGIEMTDIEGIWKEYGTNYYYKYSLNILGAKRSSIPIYSVGHTLGYALSYSTSLICDVSLSYARINFGYEETLTNIYSHQRDYNIVESNPIVILGLRAGLGILVEF